MINLLKPIIGLLTDFSRNRLMNKKTPTGILVLLSAGYGFNYLNEKQVNFLITLLSSIDFDIWDFYILLLNGLVIFAIAMGCWLTFAKVKAKIKKEGYK